MSWLRSPPGWSAVHWSRWWAGGTGKSRLAIEVGRAVDAEFSDGVWFIVGRRERSAAGRRHGGADARDRRGVESSHGRASHRPPRGRRLLFILDNCEHLAGACAELVPPVLSGAPGVRILATSRQPLGLGGEELGAGGTARLPPPEVRREQAMRSAAVQLFIERATAARPSFTFDDEDLGRIVEVVRGLEGIPLAIELAAARASVLTPSQIADRLDDKFRLLRSPVLPWSPDTARWRPRSVGAMSC